MRAGDRIALNPIQWLATEDGWLDFARQIEPRSLLAQIREAGFDGTVAEVPPGWSLDQYRAALKEIGLALAPGYFTIRLAEDGADEHELPAHAAAFAREQAALGQRTAFVSAGMSPSAPRVRRPAEGHAADPRRIEHLIAVIGEVARAMLGEGVRPALHQHVGTWIETEAEARAVLEAVDENLLAFGPDTGHLAWAGADVMSLITDYAGRITAVHVKDCCLSVAARARANGLTYQQTVMTGLWAEPGRGELDLDTMLGALPVAFDGWLIVEVDRATVPDPFESAKISADWMRSRRRR